MDDETQGAEVWLRANEELKHLVGDVTLTITEIEDSLGELILDLLVQPPVHSFYRQHVLEHSPISRRVDLLVSYVKAMPECMTNAELALDLLGRIAQASRERNRLVHDLHEVDFEHGHITRRRKWEEEPVIVDINEYRHLVGALDALAAPGIDALYDAMTLPVP